MANVCGSVASKMQNIALKMGLVVIAAFGSEGDEWDMGAVEQQGNGTATPNLATVSTQALSVSRLKTAFELTGAACKSSAEFSAMQVQPLGRDKQGVGIGGVRTGQNVI